MEEFICPCGYVYDPKKGDATQNIEETQRLMIYQKIGCVRCVVCQKICLQRNNNKVNLF